MSGTKTPLDLDALFPELERIGDEPLRASIRRIWQELWQASAFERLEQVSVSAHYTYPHIKHCQGVLRAALAAADAWESVHDVTLDRDVLIAGALLMDVSKLVEFGPGGGDGDMRPTDIGHFLPHATYAAHRALELGVPLEVVHIIATHSGNSSMTPRTVEGYLLYWMDMADISVFGRNSWQRAVHHFPGGHSAISDRAGQPPADDPRSKER